MLAFQSAPVSQPLPKATGVASELRLWSASSCKRPVPSQFRGSADGGRQCGGVLRSGHTFCVCALVTGVFKKRVLCYSVTL